MVINKKNSHNLKDTKVGDLNGFITERSKIIIINSLVGWLGACKFYEGKRKQGYLYILLDLTIVGAIFTIVASLIYSIQLLIKKDNSPKEFLVAVVMFIYASISTVQIANIVTLSATKNKPVKSRILKEAIKIDEQKTEDLKNFLRKIENRENIKNK